MSSRPSYPQSEAESDCYDDEGFDAYVSDREAGAGGESEREDSKPRVRVSTERIKAAMRASTESLGSAYSSDAEKDETAEEVDPNEFFDIRIGATVISSIEARLRGLSFDRIKRKFPHAKKVPLAAGSGTPAGGDDEYADEDFEEGEADADKEARERVAKALSSDRILRASMQSLVLPKRTPKSDGFVTLADRRECTFKPRTKASQDREHGGKDRDTRTREFLRRMDNATWNHRREIEVMQGESEYEYKPKKSCPVCGQVQTYEQILKGEKRCKGEFCDGAKYVFGKTFNRHAFESRQRSYAAKREAWIAKKREEEDASRGKWRRNGTARRRNHGTSMSRPGMGQGGSKASLSSNEGSASTAHRHFDEENLEHHLNTANRRAGSARTKRAAAPRPEHGQGPYDAGAGVDPRRGAGAGAGRRPRPIDVNGDEAQVQQFVETCDAATKRMMQSHVKPHKDVKVATRRTDAKASRKVVKRAETKGNSRVRSSAKSAIAPGAGTPGSDGSDMDTAGWEQLTTMRAD